MELTTEVLKADLAELGKQKDELIANLNAVNGAMQYVKGKIKALEVVGAEEDISECLTIPGE